MNQMGVGVCYRLLIVVACTLSGAREQRVSGREKGNETSASMEDSNNDNQTCHSPCGALQGRVSVENILYPFGIALASWLLCFLPTVVVRARHKALAIRALCWPVLFTFVSMWGAHALFFFKRDKVLAYAWSLHSSTTGLYTFSPHRALVTQRFLFFVAPLLCLTSLCLYAIERGPPVGIVPWASGQQAQCGWMVHFTAVMSSEVLIWALSPLGRALWAM